jgi:hypothetical protein
MSGFSAGIVLAPMLYAIWTWRGVWRWLAITPFLVMVGYVLLAMVLVSYDPTFLTKWMVILKVLYYAGGAFVCCLWTARGLIRLATKF